MSKLPPRGRHPRAHSASWTELLGKIVRPVRFPLSIALMADLYRELLIATISHLEMLKEHGVGYVAVAPETLSALSAGPRRISPQRTRPERVAPGLNPTAEVDAAGPVPQGSLVEDESPDGTALAVPSPRSGGRGSDLNRATKEAGMADLRARALVCQKCPHLVRSRRQVVFGVGDIHSPLMFVGEAPGADEDVQGEPFVGKAGQLLTRIIQAMDLSRETVYIANVLKCRPDTPGQTSGNRKPTSREMETCLPYLLAQIDLIQPRVLVALGATALEGLFGRPIPITKARGKFLELRGIPVMPTYHPSYLLRNQTLAVKRQVWEDMLQVMEKLALPITEKQRRYFLKSAT